MGDTANLIKKVNAVIDLLRKADPVTKLPGIMVNKASPAPAAPPPSAPKMAIPKPSVPKPPTTPHLNMSANVKKDMGSGNMMYMNQEMGKTYTASEADKGHHLAKWMHKAMNSMKMKKNDMERERITDGVVANERRKDNQEEQRKEHDAQISEHKKAANAYKEDKIDQDKGHDPVHPGKEKVIPQVTKTEELKKPYASDAQRKKFHAMENRGEISHATVAHWDKESKGKHLPEHVAKALGGTGAPSTPTARPNAGYGAVVAKDDTINVPSGNENRPGQSEAGAVVRQMQNLKPGGPMKARMTGMLTEHHKKLFNTLKTMKKPNIP